MSSPRVVIVGATGAVGEVALRVLEERNFPLQSLRLCASPRSYGKLIKFRGVDLEVEEATAELFAECDIALISVSSEISRILAPLAVEQGCVVIDDSSAFRMDPSVPLVVPEINAEAIDNHQGILSIPNCSTTPMVMALYPLHRVNPIIRIIADTYQSVSGTGKAAVEELNEQSMDVLNGKSVTPSVYPHQIAFNVLPHIEPFLENGYTREEWKMVEETRKIMNIPSLAVSATCVRVPVPLSHSAAIHAEFAEPIDPKRAREVMGSFPGIEVIDDPGQNRYPMPVSAAGSDSVLVGRVRGDASNPNGLAMWIASDNLRKGAATNGVQIAEELIRRKAFLRS